MHGCRNVKHLLLELSYLKGNIENEHDKYKCRWYLSAYIPFVSDLHQSYIIVL